MGFETALEYSETRLRELAERLDTPVDALGERALVLGITRRTMELYAAVLREVSQDGIPAALVIARAVIEAMILVRWIEDAPDLRIAMYHADDDRQRLLIVRKGDEARHRRGLSPGPAPISAQEEAKIKADLKAVRRRARDAGEPLKEDGPLLPQTQQMALSTRDTAAWEAYEFLYRIASPWTHSGGRSLMGHRFEQRSDGRHLVLGVDWTPIGVRALIAPTVAILLGSASRICGIGIEGECRVIQNTLAEWEGR